MQKEQYVCTVCGFNMVGYYPNRCPFCGAYREHFITAEECSAKFQVRSTSVNERVTRLNSVPRLGYEHAAYAIATNGSLFWIDCPSCFDKGLKPPGVIMFTHHHFLGASNTYREHFHALVKLHKKDSVHRIARTFTFDELFEENFTAEGIEAFHIGGHTPGFTIYIFEDILFLCDYVFFKGETLKFNPYGPEKETRAGGRRINEIIKWREITTVCGYNYVAEYSYWNEKFDDLLSTS